MRPSPRPHTRPASGSSSRLTAVLGPTNTGKTHLAVERMMGHETGMIGLPLRLLAREIYDRVVREKGAAAVALITGEEKISPLSARYFICTVEAMPTDRPVSFLAIDEIQLCADPERGHVFTHRLLHARGEYETMFLGAETMRAKIKALLGDITFVDRPRFSHLTFAGSKKISRLPRRSAIVAFSADNVYSIAELIRRQRGGAAVVLGALSPRTRNAQVALYQSGEVDFLVATDAIGMGLNMDVDHVAFASLAKFDGHGYRTLASSELAQIAGRAGRYMNDGTFGTTADAGQMDDHLIEQIETHHFDPIRTLQWRNPSLNFASVESLIRSLDAPANAVGLMRSRDTDDLRALRSLAKDDDIRRLAAGPAAVKTLWNVCQVPDFRKTMHDEHVRLLGQIYRHLMSHEGVINEDWLAGMVDRLDRPDGDLDTLSNRIAHTRTWTFVSNRSGWLKNPSQWQDRTQTIENRLSDALHQRLTQRFIDRRTSILLKRLKDEDALNSEINIDGEVTVEGEYIGRLSGFRFHADPRVTAGAALEGKALRAAATKALEPEIAARAAALVAAPDSEIELKSDGTIWWHVGQVARLTASEDALTPAVEFIADSLMSAATREQVQERLRLWLASHIETTLAPLAELRVAVSAPVKDTEDKSVAGLARGIGYRMVEALGFLNRPDVQDEIRILDQPARAQLRKLGVRFGEFSIYMPALLKPACAKLLVILRNVVDGAQADGKAREALPPGLTSAAADRDLSATHYNAAGFRRCGARVVRIDMLERLAELIRDQKVVQLKAWKKGDAGERPYFTFPAFRDKPRTQWPRGAFEITPDMMSLMGCSGEEFDEILKSLNYNRMIFRLKGTEDRALWRMQMPQLDRQTGRGRTTSEVPQDHRAGAPKKDGKDHAPSHKAKGNFKGKSANRRVDPGRKPAPTKPAPKPMDPDSPFAILKSLKD